MFGRDVARARAAAVRRGAVLGAAALMSMPGACRRHPAADEGGGARPAPAPAEAWQSWKCARVADFGRPLVFDLDADSRAKLDAAARRGLVVVSYDCSGLQLLPDCTSPARYSYSRIGPGQDRTLDLLDAHEVALSLPAAPAHPHLGALPARIRLHPVWMWRTQRASVLRADLQGECGRATHFVRGWDVGSTSRAPAVPPTCDGSEPARAGDCAQPLELELVAIASDADQGRVLAGRALTLVTEACADGLVSRGGVCTLPQPQFDYHCREGEIPTCEARCAEGHAGSCTAFALALRGQGSKDDVPRIVDLLRRACEGGDDAGCAHFAASLSRGVGGAKDGLSAERLYARLCDRRGSAGCYELGFRQWTVRGTAPQAGPQAARYFERACAAGVGQGCNGLGYALAEGIGMKPDAARALALFEETCRAGDAAACDSLGEAYEKGWGTAVDLKRALAQYQAACQQGVRAACVNVRRLQDAASTRPAQ